MEGPEKAFVLLFIFLPFFLILFGFCFLKAVVIKRKMFCFYCSFIKD